jgi:uncharacterized coiled-coil DUF342 family protein
MVSRSTAQQVNQQTETEIAVLRVQFSNLNEKVDDLKTGLKEVNESVKASTTATMNAIKTMEEGSKTAHSKLDEKISALEKWRWMVMGGVALAGALGFHVVGKIFGI